MIKGALFAKTQLFFTASSAFKFCWYFEKDWCRRRAMGAGKHPQAGQVSRDESAVFSCPWGEGDNCGGQGEEVCSACISRRRKLMHRVVSSQVLQALLIQKIFNISIPTSAPGRLIHYGATEIKSTLCDSCPLCGGDQRDAGYETWQLGITFGDLALCYIARGGERRDKHQSA